MDPPHITEFASERYFSKLNQINEPGTQAPNGSTSANGQTVVQPPAPIQAQTTFILPLRASKPETESRPPEPKKEKKGLFGFRSKLLHSKQAPQPAFESPVVPPKTVPSTIVEPAPHTSTPLDQLFLGLPNELQIQIINSLPLADILNLRLASKSWHTLITLNEAPIVRYHLDHHIPAYALRLYPAQDPSKISFHHLCSLWHRLHVAAKLSYMMCEWITKEIFLRKTKAQRQDFVPQRERMYRRLIPLLFTIFHFFEMYRKLHAQYIAENGHGLRQKPYTINPIEAQIMSMYDGQTLLRVHQVFPLVISSFCRQLRPPSYVGRVERSLRGYLREKPPDEVHVAILCLGGLRQVERFWEMKGYNHRRAQVDAWYSTLSKGPVPESKPKRSLMTLGRKKSMAAIKQGAIADGHNAVGGMGGSNCGDVATATNSYNSYSSINGYGDGNGYNYSNGNGYGNGYSTANGTGYCYSNGYGTTTTQGHGLIFNTSLAAGMPMSPLSSDSALYLLPDLPQLQSIWLTTAEAIILDRGIVSRSQDILRNAQVMLELIREDGIDEEEEWLYGRNAPDSVRPPLEALEDDGVVDGVAPNGIYLSI